MFFRITASRMPKTTPTPSPVERFFMGRRYQRGDVDAAFFDSKRSAGPPDPTLCRLEGAHYQGSVDSWVDPRASWEEYSLVRRRSAVFGVGARASVGLGHGSRATGQLTSRWSRRRVVEESRNAPRLNANVSLL